MIFFLSFLLFVLLIIILCLYIDFFYSFYLGVPTLSSKKKVVDKIINEIDFSSCKKYYELGSGNGKVIGRIAGKFSRVECVGIERNPVQYGLALARNLIFRQKVSYQRKNFFSAPLTDADIIYAYLFPAFMEPLNEKFQRELKKGTIVISNSFPIKSKSPLKIIEGKKGSLSTLYVYTY